MKMKKWTSSKQFQQIIKFVVVGVINTAIDLAVLNLLIYFSHTGRSGLTYSFFKGISFLVALFNSYLMNRAWTFSGSRKKGIHIEFSQFLIISLIGFGINVAVASVFVTYVHPLNRFLGIWPSVGALIGTVFGLIWNYIGYKYFVFIKEDSELLPPA